jgi:hypothetical protein
MICQDTIETLTTLLAQWENHRLVYPHDSDQELDSIRNNRKQKVGISGGYDIVY